MLRPLQCAKQKEGHETTDKLFYNFMWVVQAWRNNY